MVHRSQKEFAGKEQLPFTRFGMNQAYKYDMTDDILSVTSYPDTFRRVMLDFAVKIVTKSRKMILKVSQTTYDTLKIGELWEQILKQSPVFVT